jgi:YHS domain-containing protein
MKYLFVLFFAFSSLAFAQAQKSAVFSSDNGAIKGYDPVAYFTDGKPVKGLDSITFSWQGAVWHFANAEHRDLFAAAPAKYAPQYGGWCAYGWSQGYPAKIDPEAWSIVDGKLYLNYNLDVRDDWDKRRAEYIQKADANYQKNFGKGN